MLFWIFVIMLVVGLLLAVMCDYDYEELDITMIVIGIIGVFGGLCAMGATLIGVDGRIAANQAKYDSLVYQYENNIYENDNDIGKRELMKDIEEWNKDLAWYQANQDDFWLGIFIPNIYDQFEYIELK